MNYHILLVILLGLIPLGCGPRPNPPRPTAPPVALTPTRENTPVALTGEPTVPVAPPSPIPAGVDVCPTAQFVEVQAHPANGAYPAPELNVSCTDDEIIVRTNNIPNFEFIQITPNQLAAQNLTFRFPRRPVKATTTTAIPLLGPAAVSVTGLVIFGPTESPRDNYRDPYLDNILDYCNGHTAPRGFYHFHARPDCLFATLDNQIGLVIGYAFDGYPILAPYLCGDAACTSVKKLQSSWAEVNPSVGAAWERFAYQPGLGDLDQCNGLEFADGSYAYFATDTFPYFMGCYHGVVNTTNFARR